MPFDNPARILAPDPRQRPTLPESTYGIVLLQEAWTKLEDEPIDAPGVLYTMMHWLGDFNSAEKTLDFIETLPQIHGRSIQGILNEPGIIGRVKIGIYALDINTVGDSNLAGMCRLGSSNSASENPDDALRVETIREILTTRHEPVLGTSFFLPATQIPHWREESAAEVIQGLQQMGTWGLGKSAD